MGKLEVEVKKDIRRTKMTRAVIGTIAAAGVLSVALLAPNAMAIFRQFSTPPKDKRRAVRQSLQKLIECEYAKIKEGEVELTKKGEALAALMGEGKLKIKIPRRWDGKWRMIIFDIPHARKRTREQIRFALQNFGFLRLQNSVWIFPYDCEDLMMLLKEDLRVGSELLYVIADKIERDFPLRKHFGLK